MKFRFLIVDDEPLARKLIAAHASHIEALEPAGACGNAIEAINFLRTKPVDLVFLDVQMPEVTGIQFVRSLKKPPAVIFTTAYRDFAPEAFELEAIDYLLKPISFERFVKSVNKFFEKRAAVSGIVEKKDAEGEFLYLKSGRKIQKIALPDVLYIESLDDYVKVHLKDKIFITRENISSLEQKLANGSFVRIHRSFIVSTRFVNSVSAEGVEVGNKILPFGRAFRHGALAALGLHLK